MSTLRADLLAAFRALRWHRSYAVSIALLLSLGVGVSTGVFSVLSAALAQDLPVQNPQELFLLKQTTPRNSRFSYLEYKHYADNTTSFEGLSAFSSVTLPVGEASTEKVNIQVVSGNYFDLLGVRPILGRPFSVDEGSIPRAYPVSLLSYAFWQKSFRLSPEVLGKTVKVVGHTFTVIGVMPKGFSGVEIGFQPDVWVTLMMQPVLAPEADLLNPDRGAATPWLGILGRLKRSTDQGQARTEMAVLDDHLRNISGTAAKRNVDLISGRYGDSSYLRLFLILMSVLSAGVGLILIISLGGIASLMFARMSQRRRETAVRIALGATRFQAVRNLLCEAFLLSVFGAGGGLLLAAWVGPVLLVLSPVGNVKLDPKTDLSVFLFALVCSTGFGLLASLFPVVHISKTEVALALNGELGVVPPILPRSLGQRSVVATQVFLSFVLVGVGMLGFRTVRNMLRADSGFDPTDTFYFELRLSPQMGNDFSSVEFHTRVVNRLKQTPGIVGLSVTNNLPFGGNVARRSIEISGYEPRPDEKMDVAYSIVGPDFMRVQGIDMIDGREFSFGDTAESWPVIIVNEAMARRFWPQGGALGRRVRVLGRKYAEVVGIASDTRDPEVGWKTTPKLYLPVFQSGQNKRSMFLLIRTAQLARSTLATLASEIASIDPQVQVLTMGTMQERIKTWFRPVTAYANVIALLGIFSVTLALYGVYALTSYFVESGRREIGIRLALGASSGRLVRLVVIQGVVPGLIGVAIGLPILFAFERVLSPMLYGIGNFDLFSFLVLPALFVLSGVAASFFPAVKTTTIDPVHVINPEAMQRQ